MDTMKEIKDRLKKVSCLLGEVEDILSKGNSKTLQSKDNDSVICICGKERNCGELVVQPGCLFNNSTKNNNSTTCETNQNFISCVEKQRRERVKCGESNRNSTDTDNDSCSRKSCKNTQDKSGLKVPRDSMYNKSTNDIENDFCKSDANEQFQNKLCDIKQKFLSYFGEMNKDESDIDVGTPKFCCAKTI